MAERAEDAVSPEIAEVTADIVACGNEVRELKAAKADFSAALEKLKAAKAKFKALAGHDYGKKPKPKLSGEDEFELYNLIVAATTQLKTLEIKDAAEAERSAKEEEINSLKARYKAASGSEFELSGGKKKKKKKNKNQNQQPQGGGEGKMSKKQLKRLKKGKGPKKEKPKWGAPGSKAKKKAAKKKQQPKAPFVNPTPKGEKKKFTEFPAQYDPQVVEAAWQDWWEASGFYDVTAEEASGLSADEKFVMVIPPPNVTGSLHLGHALMGAIEDCLTRWHRMSGRKALWVPGTDHAGIATQSVVERRLYKDTQQTRHDLGREKFLEKVWEWKHANGTRITKQLRSLGSSCSWERECFTMDKNLNVAVNEAFVRMYEKGIIYREERLVNWCCALNTAISNIEVDSLELKERKSIKVPGHTLEKYTFGEITEFKYPIEDSEEVIHIATTRLETMMGDTAVAVHPDDERFKHLHGKFIKHPFNGRRIPIIADAELVKIGFGTGAVKVTPAHDENDYAVGKRHNLEFINILNDDGTMNANAAPFEGIPRFDARLRIEEELKAKGLFVGKKLNVGKDGNCMVIPRCSRSGDIIEPRLKPQWYVDCTEMAARAVAAVRSGELRLIPKVHEQTWFYYLENIRPWCISRQLWWGHRIPAYEVFVDGQVLEPPEGTSERAAAQHAWVVGRTPEEAMANAVKLTGVDESRITLNQDEDVLDTWFSSGLWPFSVFGWPEKTPDLEAFYPTKLLETGHDILFFWVARMVMMGLELTDQLPFTDVYLHAMVRDAHGRKMSKAKGNVIDPLEVIYGATLEQLNEKLFNGNLPAAEVAIAQAGQAKDFPNGIPECGTDALRFGLLEANGVGKNVNLNIRVVEVKREFCNKMWQATRFMMGKLTGFEVTSVELIGDVVPKLQPRDKWILNRLNEACELCDKAFSTYHISDGTTAVFNFFLKQFCDVYIELTKPVFQREDNAEERDVTMRVLWTVLDNTLRLFHPFMPFVTEELWQRLPGRGAIPNEPPSIMLAPYPKPAALWHYPDSIEPMALALQAVSSMRSLVQPYGLRRSHNAKAYLVTNSEDVFAVLSAQGEDVASLVSGVGSVEAVLSPEQKPEGCLANPVTAEVTAYVELKGVIDFSKELAKKQKKVAQLEALVAKHENVIKNAAAKMSEDALAKKTAVLEKYRSELEANREQLESIRGLV